MAAGLALVLLTIACLCSGCHTLPPDESLRRYEFKHPAMGTLFTITLYSANPTNAQAAAELAFRRVDALEDIMSDYQADSELMRLCDQPFGTAVPVSADLFKILQLSQRISELSNGAFDVTVGPYVRLWRFARKRKVLPTPAELEAARAAVGWRNLRLDPRRRTATLLAPNMRLDLGGIGKGYTADAALAVLKQQGINRALVAASGDIAIGRSPPGAAGWKVGIAAIGTRSNQVERSVLLHDAGISTSGDSEQFIEINGLRYSHILDPATGLGLTNRIQATIIGPNATTTDSLDTTVSILGVQRGLALADSIPRTGALIVTKDDGLTRSYASRRFAKFLRHAESAPEPRVAR
jgi:thiamine biosynthesis lipoprotein